jgi:site-specific recombinase XerC
MGVQSEATLPYLVTEVSLKAAPAASIRATEAQAQMPRNASLREQIGSRRLLSYPLFETIRITDMNMRTFQQKEFNNILP